MSCVAVAVAVSVEVALLLFHLVSLSLVWVLVSLLVLKLWLWLLLLLLLLLLPQSFRAGEGLGTKASRQGFRLCKFRGDAFACFLLMLVLKAVVCVIGSLHQINSRTLQV